MLDFGLGYILGFFALDLCLQLVDFVGFVACCGFSFVVISLFECRLL